MAAPENGDSCANFEDKTISVQYQGSEIFQKENGFLKKINSKSYLPAVALGTSECPHVNPTVPRQAPK